MIGDVELPPWADSAHEFIHLHREVGHTYIHVVYIHMYIHTLTVDVRTFAKSLN